MYNASMIIYDLICDAHHEFEGWFKNSEDMDAQHADGLLTCPMCNSEHISKKPAAVKIGKKTFTPARAPGTRSQQVAVGGGESAEKFARLQEMLVRVHDYIDRNFEDVGNRFAEEAISIHRGEKDPSNIRGTATGDQLKEMAEQGVEAIPLPVKPIDRKKIN